MQVSGAGTAGQSGTGATRLLARHAAEIRYEALPKEAVEASRILFLDGLGCLIAGVSGPAARLGLHATEPLFGAIPQASVFAAGRKASVRDAALVNGITLYSVGLNDLHKPSGAHPAGCILSALLATAEWQGIGGKDMLAAMNAGYDVMGSLGRAMMPSHRDRGFHPTGTFGPFGAAAATGRLLGLTVEQMTWALGIASSHAAGIKAFHADGSLTMVYHAGRAAADGVSAALFARSGFTGPATAVEDSEGFARAAADAFDADAIAWGPGRRHEVLHTTIRPWYGCGLTIGASGLLAQLLQEIGPGGRIAGVQVAVNRKTAAEVSDANPRTLLAARLSLQFNLALVLTRGDVLVADVTEDQLGDREIRGHLDKVQVETDDSLSRYESRISVLMTDGSRREGYSRIPKGDPENGLDWNEAAAKFARLVSQNATPTGAGRIVDIVAEMERHDGGDIAGAIHDAMAG